MKFLSLLIGATLTLSSCSKRLPDSAKGALNQSALYAPPTVTTVPGQTYQFQEGTWTPRHPEKLHSHYSYMRAIVIGGGK